MDNIDFNSTKLTQALVKCKSVTPVDDGALEIVEKHLSSIGFKCTPLLSVSYTHLTLPTKA